MPGQQKALVLDFGGVISLTEFETHRTTEETLGLPTGTLTWRGPFDPSTDVLWRAMQAGDITERQYWIIRTREIGALIGEEWTSLPQYLQRVVGDDPMSSIRPEAIDTIGKAKSAGVRLAVLSNELDLFYGDGYRASLPFMSSFEAVIDATYTKILKPDPQAYGFVTTALAVEPSDCVFVDDQPKNVRGADEFGMKAVQFDVTDPKSGFDQALSLLGLG